MEKKDYCIVYAEDDKRIRTGYLNFLKMEFSNVYGAKNGREALDLYEKVNPDIMILDINMPIVDGLQVAKTIREENEKIKLVMLTAYSDRVKLLQAIELNLFKYLIKPVSSFEFRDVLYSIIEQLEKDKDDFYTIDKNFKWNLNKNLLYKNKQIVSLTKKETLLLNLFCSNPETVYSNEDILDLLWKDEKGLESSTNKIRSLFSKLKNKIDSNLFVSIYGVGYRLK